MSLTIHPDPQEPAGGYAFLELPNGTLGTGPVHVAVMEVYASRWLGPSDGAPEGGPDAKTAVGAAHWQGERHEFGPYAVHAHDGADWVRIGPEIVNKIDEYTPLRISVGGQTADVTWPDDVPPRAGAAVLGGLQSTAKAKADDMQDVLVGRPVVPEPETEPEPDPQPPEMPGPIEPERVEDTLSRRRTLWLLLFFSTLLILIAATVAAWLLIPRDEPAPETPVSAADTCTWDALVALDGFAATEKAIRACGDALSPETVLKIIEDAAQQDDGDALLLFGTLYDGAQVDERIETVIGLSFDHDAAKAAEYYARASAVGSDAAGVRLSATCAQLAGSKTTLAKGAYDDYCR
jgi:hypothetical protein